MDPDFKVARSWQNNIQFEHGLSDRYSVSVGAVVRQGLRPPGSQQHQLDQPDRHDDGRDADIRRRVNAATRVDPRYNVIISTQSIGESTYKNLTCQFTRRHINGIGFDVAYTLGKSEDNAPITSALVGAG